MKKIVVALLCAGAWASAQSQSQVTLSGLLDANIEHLSRLPTGNGESTSQYRLSSGGSNSTRWAIRGTEDLGDGLRAAFALVSGFGLDTGMFGENRAFQQKAIVGLESPKYGSLFAGRNLAIINGVYEFDPFLQARYSSASLAKGRNWPYLDNLLTYQSPAFRGFDLGLQYGFGETSDSSRNGRTMGWQISYTQPQYAFRVIYDEMRDKTGKLTDLFNYSREVFAGASAMAGNTKLMAAYTWMNAGDAARGTPDRADYVWLGVSSRVTPEVNLIAGAYYIDVKNEGNAKLGILGAEYSLSKRTALYSRLALVRNSSRENFSVSPYDVPVTGASQTGVQLGIRHAF